MKEFFLCSICFIVTLRLASNHFREKESHRLKIQIKWTFDNIVCFEPRESDIWRVAGDREKFIIELQKLQKKVFKVLE